MLAIRKIQQLSNSAWPNLILNQYHRSLLGVKRPGFEAEHSLPSVANTKIKTNLQSIKHNIYSWKVQTTTCFGSSNGHHWAVDITRQRVKCYSCNFLQMRSQASHCFSSSHTYKNKQNFTPKLIYTIYNSSWDVAVDPVCLNHISHKQ